jgi:hypothetical protein
MIDHIQTGLILGIKAGHCSSSHSLDVGFLSFAKNVKTKNVSLDNVTFAIQNRTPESSGISPTGGPKVVPKPPACSI